MLAVENGGDSDAAMAEGDPSIEAGLVLLRWEGRKSLEKEHKALLHQTVLAYTRRTKASRAEGRRLEQLFLAGARTPQVNILLLAGDLSKAVANRFQESRAFQTLVDRADENTKFIKSVLGDVHMTEILCPNLGCAHDVYEALLAELAHPRSPHTCAFLWSTPQPDVPPADKDPPSSDAPAATPP